MISLIGAGATTMTLALSYGMPANAQSPPSASVPTAAAHSSPTTSASLRSQPDEELCYDQSSNDSGIGIVSQNFEASFDQYDAAGADDFTLLGDCTMEAVIAYGVYFSGSGQARDETVTIYKNKKGKPGAVISQQTVSGDDSSGVLDMDLPEEVPLKAGSYWLSVQVNMDFAAGGEWGWETTLDQHGYPAQWENPGNGFGTGCTSWNTLTSCINAGEGPDFMFGIEGDPILYKFDPFSQPTSDYTANSCPEGLAGYPDHKVLSKTSDPGCTKAPLGKSKPFKVSFSTPVEKLSVPVTWPNWGPPPDTESPTPNVLFTQTATTLTITYNFGVRTGGFEAQPVGTGTHTFTTEFYSGNNGTGTLLGTITRDISGNAGARLLGAHCKFKGWGSIKVSTDVPFAIAVIRV